MSVPYIQISGNMSPESVQLIQAMNNVISAINNGGIDSNCLAPGAVITQKIAEYAVQTPQLGSEVIDSVNIREAQIQAAHIEDASITNAKIGDGEIENAKIKDATIEHGKIASLDASKITTGELSANYIHGGVLDANDITVNNLHADKITVGQINGAQIADGAIDMDHLDEYLQNSVSFVLGGAHIYYQSTAPTGGTYYEGDYWFDTDDNYRAYRYTSSAWAVQSTDSGAYRTGFLVAALIAAGAVTADKIAAGTLTSNIALASELTVGGSGVATDGVFYVKDTSDNSIIAINKDGCIMKIPAPGITGTTNYYDVPFRVFGNLTGRDVINLIDAQNNQVGNKKEAGGLKLSIAYDTGYGEQLTIYPSYFEYVNPGSTTLLMPLDSDFFLWKSCIPAGDRSNLAWFDSDLANGNIPTYSTTNKRFDDSGKTFSGNGTSALTATGTLTSGNLVKFDANGNAVDAGLAVTQWTDWTPSLTNITKGSGGAVTARYFKTGKKVEFYFSFTYGTGSAVSGEASFTLPSTAANIVMCNGRILDSNGNPYTVYAIVSGSSCIVRAVNSASTYAYGVALSSSIPMTWATGDKIEVSGFYEES